METEDEKTTGNSVIVAVMGVTGAGKSSLISLITGRRDIRIGKGLRSETQKVTPYKFKHRGISYILVDTPGFNDTARTDTEILEEIVTWLAAKYSENTLLSGIVYLQPISETRVQGSTMTQLRVFKQLCGKDFYRHVVLATTFWGSTDQTIAERREAELFSTDSFLGDMKDGGSATARITDQRSDALALLENIARNNAKKGGGGVMKVQQELHKPGATFKTTLAAKALSKELIRLNQKFEAQLRAAARVPLRQKIEARWARLKHERAAKALAIANRAREEATMVENARIRAEAEAAAERARRAREERDRVVREEAERTRREHEARMAVLRAEREARDERARVLAAEEERARQEARLAEERRKKELEEMLRKEEARRKAAAEEERRVKEASREALTWRGGSVFCFKNCKEPGCDVSLWDEPYHYCAECGLHICKSCFNKGDRIYHFTTCDY